MIVIFFFMQLVLVNISAMLQGGIMKDIFKVAMLQMERSSDINNNIKKRNKNFCKNAKLMGADIAVFPEMWSNGYEILFRGLLKNQKDLDMNKVKDGKMRQ